MGEDRQRPFVAFAQPGGRVRLARVLAAGRPARASAGRAGLVAGLVLAAILPVVALAATLLGSDGRGAQSLSITDFEIAEPASQRGYSSVVVSRRVADLIDEIYRTGDSRRMRAITGDVAFDRRLPEVTIPLGGLTLEATGELARSLLGMPRNKLFGEVTSEVVQEQPPRAGADEAPESVEKTFFRVTLRTSDGRLPPRATQPFEQLDDALREAVLGLVERFDPYVAATYHLARGNLDRTRRLIAACLSNDDSDDDPWAKILVARMQLDVDIDLSSALRTYRAIMRDHPAFVLARVELAETLRVIGRPGEAADEAVRALAIDARHVPALLSLALSQQDRRDPQSALDHFRAVLRLDPRNDDAAAGEARALVRLGRPDEALAAAEVGLSRRPGSGALMTVRALVLRQLGRFEEAQSALEVALALDSRGEARGQAARLAAARGDWETAFASARMVAETGPASVPFWQELAGMAARAGRHREAVDAAREASERDPGDIPARRRHAETLVAAGRPAEALAPLLDAVRRAARDPDVRLDLFHAARAASRWRDAVGAHTALAAIDPARAAAIAPQAARAHLALAKGAARAGRRDEARAAVRSALTLDSGLRADLAPELARLIAGRVE